MADAARNTSNQQMQLAGALAGTVLVLNTLFWFASQSYYASRPLETGLDETRFAFAIFSVWLAALSYGAAVAPRTVGHGLAVLIGIAAIVGGIASFVKDLQPVVAITLLVVGVVMPTLAYHSIHRRRVPWAFTIAFASVFGCVTLFGAPKVRTLLGINMWYALIIPGVQIICVVALSMLRDEYRD